MTRKSKSNYPADNLVSLLSKTQLGGRVANRLIPQFMRRSNSEVAGYSSYGDYFDWILDPNTKAAGFMEVKRQKYFKEPEEVKALLAGHNIDLKDKSMLDVSGGPGTFAYFMKGSVGKIAVSEYDAKTVEAMQSRLPDVRIFQADLASEWTDKESFDVVLYRSCLVFCADLAEHFRHLSKLVNDGGYAYIYTAKPSLGNTLRYQYEDYTLHVLYDEKYLIKLLRANGFEIIARGDSKEYSHYLKFFDWREALPLLWGVWNLLIPHGPGGVDARAYWVLARKTSTPRPDV